MTWGVFDSGVGGLTVVRALKSAIDAPIVYLGDTARVPYGTRSVATVRSYAREAARFFARAEVDGLIVACNTVSAVALDVVEDELDDSSCQGPVIGVVEPGVASALAASAEGASIGVIGTPATIRSNAYATKIVEARPRTHVVSAACPLFVPLAEEGWIDGDVPRLVAERYFESLKDAKVSTLILGCTHYPLLKSVIQDVMGPEVTLVDSAEAVARAAASVAAESAEEFAVGKNDRFCVTDAGGSFAKIAERFLGCQLGELETVQLSS